MFYTLGVFYALSTACSYFLLHIVEPAPGPEVLVQSKSSGKMLLQNMQPSVHQGRDVEKPGPLGDESRKVALRARTLL